MLYLPAACERVSMFLNTTNLRPFATLGAFSAFTALSLLCGAAHAHSPLMSCYAEPEQHIMCEGGFSDGGSASGVPVTVLSYEDATLWSGKFDEKAQVRFKRPQGSFFIRFEGGVGHTVEIDHNDVR